jgi:hypothetical protein
MSQLVYLCLQSRDRTFKRGDAPIIVIPRRGDRRAGRRGWHDRLFWRWGK